MATDTAARQRFGQHLAAIYGRDMQGYLQRLLDSIESFPDVARSDRSDRWNESDVVLITYGDQVRDDTGTALAGLRQFLLQNGLEKVINTLHLLPFFPYSSDDGFSVIDYRTVDPQLGNWQDIANLRADFELMFDLVLNHVSSQGEWFQQYVTGQSPYDEFFIEVDPQADLSQVTRPRSHPLLTEVETNRGARRVWTTFSADQVDLNFGSPHVLLEMVDLLLFYLQQGARILRLDAIAYLWKRIGTNCIHLPETHEVVRLLRSVLDAVAPQALLLTETNVPHQENVSYLGSGDEAHLVYQFSLPPLLLDALIQEDASVLRDWLESIDATPEGTTFLNFTASHDGIGVRPLEGLVSQQRFDELVAAARLRGGRVNTRRTAEGHSPYELNISYFDALTDPLDPDPDWSIRRFLASQAVMLGLRGIPAVYFHSLVGSRNDTQGVAESGEARRINRAKLHAGELDAILQDPDSQRRRVLDGYRHLLQVRIKQPAFHPDADQQVGSVDDLSVLRVLRTSIDGTQQILMLANMSHERRACDLNAWPASGSFSRDLLSGTQLDGSGRTVLQPFQVAWFSAT